MAADTRYDDGNVVLDHDGITLRRYYFPVATSKRIPYGRIRAVRTRPMGWLTGKGRLWGSGDLRHWLPLDGNRGRKTVLVVLDTGHLIKPAFSPADPDQVLQILAEHTSSRLS